MEDHADISLIILDLQMPGVNDLGLLQSLCNAHPDIPVVVLSGTENPRTMQRAIEHGAAGYIPKSSANNVLISALQLVLAGGVYIPTEVLSGTTDEMKSPVPETGKGVASEMQGQLARDMFTGRQKDVLELLAAGHSNKVIAKELGVSEHTVKIHLSAIFRIMGVHNRTEAAIACREQGLIGTE